MPPQRARGGVKADRLSGSLRVKTASGSISVDELRGGLSVETNSGAVDGWLNGPGAVDVRTNSSAITLRGVSGSLTVSTGQRPRSPDRRTHGRLGYLNGFGFR